MNKSKRFFNKIRVSVEFNQNFHGFTLQRNSLFGEDEHGYFVCNGQLTQNGKQLIVYRQDDNKNVERWHKTFLSVGNSFAKRIFDKRKELNITEIEFSKNEKLNSLTPNIRKNGNPFPYKKQQIPYAGHHDEVNNNVTQYPVINKRKVDHKKAWTEFTDHSTGENSKYVFPIDN